MKPQPVVYVLEGRISETGLWMVLRDDDDAPLIFKGSGSKAKACGFGKRLSLWRTFQGLRVQCGSETVWSWKREA